MPQNAITLHVTSFYFGTFVECEVTAIDHMQQHPHVDSNAVKDCVVLGQQAYQLTHP